MGAAGAKGAMGATLYYFIAFFESPNLVDFRHGSFYTQNIKID